MPVHKENTWLRKARKTKLKFADASADFANCFGQVNSLNYCLVCSYKVPTI